MELGQKEEEVLEKRCRAQPCAARLKVGPVMAPHPLGLGLTEEGVLESLCARRSAQSHLRAGPCPASAAAQP